MKGSTFRRCGACKKRVDAETCCPTGSVTWCYRVDVGSPGNRRQRRGSGFKRKKDAEAAMAAEVTDRSRQQYLEQSNVTLAEFIDGTFLPLIEAEVQAGRLARNTASDYRRNLEIRVVPHIGELAAQTVRPSDLQKLYAKLTAEGFKPKTISNTARTLHRVFEVAIDDELVRANPAKRAKAPKVERTAPSTLTVAELETLIGYVAEHDLEFLAALLLYVTTGTRRGETLGLRWSDVDLEAGVARIVQQVTTEDGVCVIKKLKTEQSNRVVPLEPEVVEALKAHRNRARATSPAAWGADALVFARTDGSPQRPQWVNRHLARAVKRSGVTTVSPHGLRHSVATLLLDQGAPLPSVTALLGHSSPTITLNVYSHAVAGAERKAVGVLGAAIFKRDVG